ncbi:hypothetical protein VOLCADRAFT_106515 [Volvox carteri f. nagariensis]|uniref:RsdA/BaiN/AoA(So)-like insert domain-containing protein n=1 Tax=Volvox carteri f. nagariensis TaxID=3068 RepID=D8U814_VOLCA|nr:uncharacterized protein VOLCADRAFT_106515 [Volvox carteri f. nagariensis]EFJ44188.1 hypothetical protein VOLCADRAFT_106515 [Volvox carteri f. nagariensis]|eukprot:XP_002954782.1 hypothetical protein VOLCADRAFT_106515 [Volvox carteri f. nagariensis]
MLQRCSSALQNGSHASGPSSSPPYEPIHVTIVGGGAAGLTAAFFAAEHGARLLYYAQRRGNPAFRAQAPPQPCTQVTVLERTREAGKKILMSGGARCNVLPFEVDIHTDYFSESSASAVRAVFASWNLDLCKACFRSRLRDSDSCGSGIFSQLEDPHWGVGLDLQLEEETRKYFPSSNSAREVRDRLVAACQARGVVFKYNASVEGLQLLQTPQEEDGNVHVPPPAVAAAAEPPQGPVSEPAVSEAATVGGVAGAAAAVEVVEEDLGAVRRASAAAAGPAGVDGVSGGGGGGGGAGGGEKGVGGGSGARKGKKGRGPRISGAELAVAVAAAEAEAAAASSTTNATAQARWLCRLQDGTEHVTDKLVIATGGLSFPAVGTDGTGHLLIRALGHSLHEPYPALTPLTGAHPAGGQLAGVSMYGIELSVQVPGVRRPKFSERTAFLFTHRGYSGPAVLDLSHYAVKALARGHGAAAAAAAAVKSVAGAAATAVAGSSGRYVEMGLPSIHVNWTHESAEVWDERIRAVQQAGGTALVTTLLQRHGVRERLAEALVSELGLVDRRVCDVKKAERAALVSALTSYELPYNGHEGYKKAEVTGGGVRLEEINCATMESRPRNLQEPPSTFRLSPLI